MAESNGAGRAEPNKDCGQKWRAVSCRFRHIDDGETEQENIKSSVLDICND